MMRQSFKGSVQIRLKTPRALHVKRVNTRYIILLFILFPALLLYPQRDWAQTKEFIDIVSSPNPVGSGARALGMGGAFIGIADDATAASWNPAGLRHLVKPEISWVGAYSSRSENTRFEESRKASRDYLFSGWDINYLSMALPGRIFKRNFVFSLNFQHLYDFSKRMSSYEWDYFSEDPFLSIHYKQSFEQSGSLKALSPALAVIITPRLTLGFTLNIWSDKLFSNEWIDRYHSDGAGESGEDRLSVLTHYDKLERRSFSGLNFNLGILWALSETFTVGAVVKSPFKADIDLSREYYKIKEYPQGVRPNEYEYSSRAYREQLSMPLSYGIGLAFQPIEQMVIDLDIYRIEWEDFTLIKTDGRRINIFTGYDASGGQGRIRPNQQVRLGAEYAFVSDKSLIPTIRGGIFYDPMPAPNGSDDYYGVSLGLGVTLREKMRSASRRHKTKKQRKDIMSIDLAYQYRWGRGVKRQDLPDDTCLTDVDRHLVYLSMIYYIHGKGPF